MIEALVLARQICLLAVAVVCAYTDMAWGRLLNAVTIGGVVAGLVTAYLLDQAVAGYPHLASSALSMALGGGVLLVMYLAGGMGAGDVKLMAAVGALGLGWQFTVRTLVYTALVGAAIALGILIWQGRLAQGMKDSMRTLVTFRVRKDEARPPLHVPYGLAIGVGTLWAWFETVFGR